MKTYLLKKYSIALLGATLVSLSYGQVSHEKTIKKSYKTTTDPEVSIINKYGKVYVEQWDKDSVSFKIEVEMTSKNHLKLSKMRNSLDFEFDKSGQYITAVTTIQKSGPVIIHDLGDLLTKEDRLKIDYTVKVPKGTILNIDNKYGNVYLPDLNNRAQITLSHGDLRVNSINVHCSLEVHFGDVSIKNFEKGLLKISYGDCRIRKANNIVINSKNSEIRVAQVNKIRFDSKRDKVILEKVGSVNGEFDFSKVRINNLQTRAYMNMKFGELIVDRLAPGFEAITSTSKFTDFEIHTGDESRFKLDLVHRKVDVTLPKASLSHKTKFIDKHEFEHWTGQIGSGTTESKISIQAENSEVYIAP